MLLIQQWETQLIVISTKYPKFFWKVVGRTLELILPHNYHHIFIYIWFQLVVHLLWEKAHVSCSMSGNS